jgi:hypothetical protein
VSSAIDAAVIHPLVVAATYQAGRNVVNDVATHFTTAIGIATVARAEGTANGVSFPATVIGDTLLVTKSAAVARAVTISNAGSASTTFGNDFPVLCLQNPNITASNYNAIEFNSLDSNGSVLRLGGGIYAVYSGRTATSVDASVVIATKVAGGALTNRLTVDGTGTVSTGTLRSTSPTAGLGYSTGAGGTIGQGSGSGKATGVTLNTVTGLITMDGAVLNAGVIVSFTLTNSAIAATDTLILQHNSGGTVGAYTFSAQPAGGSALINVRNATAGNLTEAPVIRFTVIKSYLKSERKVRFRNGSVLQFGHCEDDASTGKYLSTEYDAIYFDELVTFTEKQFLLIRSRARSTKPGVTPVIKAGTNPGGPESHWVRRRFIWQDVTPKEDPRYRPQDYAYIPATLDDNPHLNQEDYARRARWTGRPWAGTCRSSISSIRPIYRARCVWTTATSSRGGSAGWCICRTATPTSRTSICRSGWARSTRGSKSPRGVGSVA